MKKAAVIGAGITGIQTALDIANAGIEVYLIEKLASIGGHMAQLSETFPTLDCSQCILTPKMVEAKNHPNIHLLVYSEVQDISGKPSDFKMKVLKKSRYVIEGTCNSCNECVKVCPVLVPSEFDRNLSTRRAIYIPFPQAVPSTYTIDADYCLNGNSSRSFASTIICTKCKEVCEAKAVNYDMQDELLELNVASIVFATGYEQYNVYDYGYGRHADVVDGLEFERLLSAAGPTGGAIQRPSDGKTPKKVVFIQCVGSRESATGKPYCSKICCMYTAKHAMLYKEKVHDGEAYVFYMDIRAPGKMYKEFIKRAKGEGVNYIRGRVSRIFKKNDGFLVHGADTLAAKKVEIAADMVVLAKAIEPPKNIDQLSTELAISIDKNGFLMELNQEFKPVETDIKGFYIAGCSSSPKDISECVSSASAAAAKAINFIRNTR